MCMYGGMIEEEHSVIKLMVQIFKQLANSEKVKGVSVCGLFINKCMYCSTCTVYVHST